MALYTAARLLSVLALAHGLPAAGRAHVDATQLSTASGGIAELSADDYIITSDVYMLCKDNDDAEKITSKVECCVTAAESGLTYLGYSISRSAEVYNNPSSYACPELESQGAKNTKIYWPGGCYLDTTQGDASVVWNEPSDGGDGGTSEQRFAICRKKQTAHETARPKGAGTHVSDEYKVLSQLMSGSAEGDNHDKVSQVFATTAHFVHAAEKLQDELQAAFE